MAALGTFHLRAADWQLPAPGIVVRDGRIELAGAGRLPGTADDAAARRALADAPGWCSDGSGGLFVLDGPDGWRLGGSLHLGSGSGLDLPLGETIRDCAIDGRDLLLVLVARASGCAVHVRDLRGRYRGETLELPELAADRLVPLADGAWLVDRSDGSRARLAGVPRHRGYDALDAAPAAVGQPCPLDADPLRSIPAPGLGHALRSLAPLAIGSWSELGPRAFAALLEDEAGHCSLLLAGDRARAPVAIALPDGLRPGALTAAPAGRLAALVPGAETVVVLALTPGLELAHAVPEPHAIPGWDGGRGDNRSAEACAAPRYRSRDDRVRQAATVARRHLATRAELIATSLDSGDSRTRWGRVMIEARIPPGCRCLLDVAVGEDPEPPPYLLPASGDPAALAAADWHPHLIGGAASAADPEAPLPRAAWLREASELPYDPGLLGARQLEQAGCFELLLQARGRAVRSLHGRYLHLRLRLAGPGHLSPAIAALRVSPLRSDWRRLLPEHWSEAPADGRSPGPACGSDFLDRFLLLFAGEYGRWRARIDHSWRLADPRTCPAEALPWLAAWLRLPLERELPVDRQRRRVATETRLARMRGTAPGLRLALDLVSGGMHHRGALVLIEDWQLNRVAGAVLGVDTGDREDPLIPGGRAGTTSIVGRNLILADGFEREFRALFIDGDAAAWREHLARRADQVTVLVHAAVDDAEIARIRHCLERECPAHVQWRLLAASAPFIVGLSALLGIDTQLGQRPAPDPVVVGRSRVGAGDRVVGRPSLDPLAPEDLA